MIENFKKFAVPPKLYAPSSNKIFWADEHISKYLLEAHLNPDIDASSRKPSFIEKSAKWISETIPPDKYPKLLDLGCGAGLYAEQFAKLGYKVTGIDFSKRSIDYAEKQTLYNKSNIDYSIEDYLALDYLEEFDLVTLIYCDFGALSDEDRNILLHKVYKALKPNGKFVLDVFTTFNFSNKEESKTWEYCHDGGFWSSSSYLCLESSYLYAKSNTELRQYIIQTEDKTECYNVWEHYFTQDTFVSEIEKTGFKTVNIYDDIAGKIISNESETICGIFSK